MITTLQVRGAQGFTLSMTLNDSASGLLVEEIGGLGPVKATLSSSSFADIDGAQFQSSRLDIRNITLKVNLRPDSAFRSVSELRKQLYKYLMPGNQVFLRFITDDNRLYDIVGYVESNDPTIFSQTPSMDVSILCFSPNFVNGLATSFELMTSNSGVAYSIENPGQMPCGVLIKLHVNRSLTQFTVYNEGESGTFASLDFSGTLIAGDEVLLSTLPGKKAITRTRAGVTQSVLNGVSPQSKWVRLTRGQNVFRVYAEGAPIPYTLIFAEEWSGL